MRGTRTFGCMKGPERAEGRVVASPEYGHVGYAESREGRGEVGVGEGGNTDLWGMTSLEMPEERLVVGEMWNTDLWGISAA
jgi:hypothetical protein